MEARHVRDLRDRDRAFTPNVPMFVIFWTYY